MSRYFAFLLLMMGLVTSFQVSENSAFAGNCICGDEVSVDETAVKCRDGHEIHKGCLEAQVNCTKVLSRETAEEIQSHGLPCPMTLSCDAKISFQDVSGILDGTKGLALLNTRLRAVNSSECECEYEREHESSSESRRPQTLEEIHQQKVREFRNQIQEAFNLCCPNSACKGVLSPIEGCNAATCEKCKSQFCYLCLAPQRNSNMSHAHAWAHSGNYWENRDGHTGLVPSPRRGYQEVEEYEIAVQEAEDRPCCIPRWARKYLPNFRKHNAIRKGVPYKYTDRYHWLIARENLEKLFQEEPDAQVKEEALAELEPLLRKNKMWPLPVGSLRRKTHSWTKEVMGDEKLDQKNKIALLQNEIVYQTQWQTQWQNQVDKNTQSKRARQRASKRVENSKKILVRMKAPVLTSLDVDPNLFQPQQNRHVTPLFENHHDERVRNLFVDLRDHHPDFFALGGNENQMYVIVDPGNLEPPFVLSAEVPRKPDRTLYTQYEAAGAFRPNGRIDEDARKWLTSHNLPLEGQCHRRGAFVMTKKQGRALARALGEGRLGGFDPQLIDGLSSTYVWTSSLQRINPDGAFYFNSVTGDIYFGKRANSRSLRCVVPLSAW